MRRWLVSLFVLLPALASAQVQPSGIGAGINPPIFGQPASAVSGSGGFSPQLYGPQSCTVPAYSFTGATTSGYGFASSSLCLAISGTTVFRVSATSAATTVPLGVGVDPPLEQIHAFASGGVGVFASWSADESLIFAGDSGSGPWVASHTRLNGTSYGNTAAVRLNFGAGGFIVRTSPATPVGNARTFTTRFAVTDTAATSAVPLGLSSGASFNVAAAAFINTAPTIGSGFGASPSITASNGTAAFLVNVGTGGTASNGVITMPAATTGWNCHVENRTGVLANVANQRTMQIATTTTSVTVENQTISTGAALAWTASDVLALMCVAY